MFIARAAAPPPSQIVTLGSSEDVASLGFCAIDCSQRLGQGLSCIGFIYDHLTQLCILTAPALGTNSLQPTPAGTVYNMEAPAPEVTTLLISGRSKSGQPLDTVYAARESRDMCSAIDTIPGVLMGMGSAAVYVEGLKIIFIAGGKLGISGTSRSKKLELFSKARIIKSAIKEALIPWTCPSL